MGKSQRRAKRRAITREINEGGERKTKHKVRIQKAGERLRKSILPETAPLVRQTAGAA